MIQVQFNLFQTLFPNFNYESTQTSIVHIGKNQTANI